jgi:hypothetical protein
LLTEFGADAEWIVNMTVIAPSDKSFRLSLPDLGTNPHAAPAQNTSLVPKGIPDLFNPATQGDILDSTGIRGLRYQQLRKVAAQVPYPLCAGQYHHAFLHIQGAGSSDVGAPIDHVLDNAQPARADIGKIGDMTQVGNTEAIFDGSIEDIGPFDCVNDSPIYANVDVLQHLDTSFSQTTRIASNLHSLWQIPHF